MSDPFVGEIRAFAFDYPPQGWVLCNGQSLSTGQYPALYAVIHNLYGGDNKLFNVPNLQGRTLMGLGAGPGLTPRKLADNTGRRSIQLEENQMPAHTHMINVEASYATQTNPTGNTWAQGWFGLSARPTVVNTYTSSAANNILNDAVLGPVGNQAAHENQQPYLTLNLCICVDGLFPEKPQS